MILLCDGWAVSVWGVIFGGASFGIAGDGLFF